jgi:hypothetical protein
VGWDTFETFSPPNAHETHFAIDISLGSGCRRGNLLLPSTLLLEQAQMHWRDINCPQWSRMRVSFDGSPLSERLTFLYRILGKVNKTVTV